MGITHASICFLVFAFLCCIPPIACQKKETLKFYLHDILTPTNYSQPTAKPVAGPAGHNGSFFGSIVIFDDKITATSSFHSPEIGRARGYYIEDAADGQSLSVLIVCTIQFSRGPHKGSTIALYGQEMIHESESFVAVVGGTKDFELARGTAMIKPFKLEAFNAILCITINLVYT